MWRSFTFLFFGLAYDRLNGISPGISFLEIAWPHGATTGRSVIPDSKGGIPASTDICSSRVVLGGESGGRTDVEASSPSIQVCGARLALGI